MDEFVGVDVLRVLETFADRELRFTRVKPIRLILPSLPKPLSLFGAVLFGDLAEETAAAFEHTWRSSGAEVHSVSNLFDAVFGQLQTDLSILDIGAWRIRNYSRGSSPKIFLLDASNRRDLVDFWNYRATGGNPIPLPIQLVADSRFNDGMIRLTARFGRPELLIVGRSVADGFIEKVHTYLGVGSLIIQKLRDTKQVVNNYGLAALLSAGRSNRYLFQKPNSNSRVSSISPKFRRLIEMGSTDQYVNEVDVSHFGKLSEIAEVIPSRIESLFGILDANDAIHWRSSDSGLVYLGDNIHSDIAVPRPSSISVLQEWYKRKGWSLKPSKEGLTSVRLANQIGGVYGLNALFSGSILNVLSLLNADGCIKASTLRNELKQQGLDNSRIQNLITSLFYLNLIELGMTIKCTGCGRHPWFRFDDLGPTVICKICRSHIRFPADRAEELRWSYGAIGVYGNPTEFRATLPVLGLMNLLQNRMNFYTTIYPGVNAQTGTICLEADLIALVKKRSRSANVGVQSIVAECKFNMPFSKRDIERAATLHADFPEAYYIFATSKGHLEDTERILLVDIAKSWESDSECARLIILTGNELGTIGAQRAKAVKKFTETNALTNNMSRMELADLAQVSQMMYLSPELGGSKVDSTLHNSQTARRTKVAKP